MVISVKIALSDPRLLNAAVERVPWYFITAVVLKKASFVMPLPDDGKTDDMCIYLSTIPRCNG